MRTLKPFNEVEMAVYSELFLDYCILGGMPAVVREFVEKGTFEGSLEVQRQLIADYKEDIRKYAEGMDQTRILNVFNHIPVQLAKDNKKFQMDAAYEYQIFVKRKDWILFSSKSSLILLHSFRFRVKRISRLKKSNILLHSFIFYNFIGNTSFTK